MSVKKLSGALICLKVAAQKTELFLAICFSIFFLGS
jgi:hypothetical protein